jgi:DNA invertase Pin-like site-specific DNA recombinase
MAAARSTLTNVPTTSSTASNWPPTISPSLTFSRNRVSTSTQDQTRNWPSSNTHAGRFPINEFVEVQISSRKKPRQRGIDGVLERLAPGDQLIVSELSRLWRSLGQVIHIVDELVKRKIRFTAIKESIHFEGKQDLQTKVMVTLFGLFAEVERDLISERTREGLASARVKGRLLGRPKGVLGKESRGWMAKRKRSAFSCKSRSQRHPSPRLSASLGPPFTALSRQGGYSHILKGYFYTNLVGTLGIGRNWRANQLHASPGSRNR